MIVGARQRNPQPAHASGHQNDPQADLPNDFADVGPIEFINGIFHAGEYVCITLPDSDDNPTVNQIHGREEWIDADFGNKYASTYGVWFCINPLKDHESRTDNNVADFRHLLVEIDSGALEEQYANLKASGLPIAALSYSGNKSSML